MEQDIEPKRKQNYECGSFQQKLCKINFISLRVKQSHAFGHIFVDVKVKGKAVPLHAMEALGGRGDIAPTHYRPRHLMGVSGQHHAPATLLPPGKGTQVPIVQEAGWAPEPVWTQRLEEKSFAPARDRTPIARSSSP
jgi:hypothetical protein